eukprot:8182535-Pyramimonas_sp.AAC.1
MHPAKRVPDLRPWITECAGWNAAEKWFWVASAQAAARKLLFQEKDLGRGTQLQSLDRKRVPAYN